MKATALYDSPKYTDSKSVTALGQFSSATPEAQQGLVYQSGYPKSAVPAAIRSDKWWSPLPRVSKMLRLVLTCSSHRAQQQAETLKHEECLTVSAFSPFAPGRSCAAEVLLRCYRHGFRTGDPSLESNFMICFPFFFHSLIYFCLVAFFLSKEISASQSSNKTIAQ